MSEEPIAPKLPESNDEPPRDDFALDKKPGEDSSPMPLTDDQRRLTGDLEAAGKELRASASESPETALQKPQSTGELLPDRSSSGTPETKPGQPKTTESLVRRLTGSIRRSTGPLDKTGPLSSSAADLPAQDVDEAFGKKAPSEAAGSTGEAEPPPQGEKKPDEPRAEETPNLVRRITGSIRRITGPLSDTSRLRPSGGAEAAQEGEIKGEQKETPAAGSGGLGEKRKRSTGPLGSVLAGILRGTTEEEAAPPQPKPDDYVSEIRQDLASEEVEQPKKQQGSGFLRLITGGFKRMTGTLGRTGEMTSPRVEKTEATPEPELPTTLEAPRSEIDAEIEEVLLEDRLSGTAISEPSTWAEPEDIVIELGPPELESFELEEPQLVEPEAEDLSGDEPISLLESGAIAALEKAEEETQQVEAGTDWMTEIRQEAVDEEAKKEAAESEEKRKGITSPLREFIAGILHPEEKQAPPAGSEVSDDLVTGRLGLGLETPPVEEGEAPAEMVEAGISEEAPQLEEIEVDDTSFLERLGLPMEESAETTEGLAEFTAPPGVEAEEQGEEIESFTPYEPLQTYRDTGQVFTITPEDEQLLWGAPPEIPTEAAEKPEAAVTAPLPGFEAAPIAGPTKPLKRRTTGQLRRESQRKPFEDIRSILLADYMEAEQRRKGTGKPQAALAAAEAAEPGQVAVPEPKNLRAWLGTRTTLQKIILVELALVILALVTAVPFFTYVFLRGNQVPVAAQTKLPPDLPYPIGLTLPGGWQFQLDRSTMKNNIWTPADSEWLEGTELRRVVALPWNRQTEAVVRSFQSGDAVELQLSNTDLIRYEVEKVEQISVEDSSIYSGTSPSLIIILYDNEGKSAERWVVFCKR